jgi:hypothetical protein
VSPWFSPDWRKIYAEQLRRIKELEALAKDFARKLAQ